MTQTMSQKLARDSLGNAETFEGGVYVTKNGVAELFIQTAAEREAEVREMQQDRNINALFKLAMQAKKEIAEGKGMTPEDVLGRLRAARN
ncbi:MULTISPECIES: hypothetical protein [Enterobacterales]|uniref:Prevent-host-death protein n=1 Tax=Pectobacterium carotovorum TaxID=554 RepID=A0A0N7FVZ7_PECCA|nr:MULTISPECIES: hypothetical protein [Enterobacterales]HCT7987701.1 hypothetical protein [Serratia liquefaciens]ALG88551.1 Hypothetical protein [Pectobacterium carotovorum]MBC3252442.1 hypothetical protein [Serratia fonticola]MBP1039025.1 hypothetical protein [Serratia fonticola]OCJ27254.1 hypothetical protein A6U95_28655 [Serratia sp. 14-2641]